MLIDTSTKPFTPAGYSILSHMSFGQVDFDTTGSDLLINKMVVTQTEFKEGGVLNDLRRQFAGEIVLNATILDTFWGLGLGSVGKEGRQGWVPFPCSWQCWLVPFLGTVYLNERGEKIVRAATESPGNPRPTHAVELMLDYPYKGRIKIPHFKMFQ